MPDPLINMAVVGPYPGLYTYKIKPAEAENLRPGCRFLVPFGRSRAVAFYVEEQKEPVKHALRHVCERMDLISPFPGHLFPFCRWVSEYYLAGLGETLAAALPGTGRRPVAEFSVKNGEFLQAVGRDDAVRFRLARILLKHGSVREATVGRDPKQAAVIGEWLEKGIIATRYQSIATRPKLCGYRLALSCGHEEPALAAVPLSGLSREVTYSRRELMAVPGMTEYRLRKLIGEKIFEKVYDQTGIEQVMTYPVRHDLPGLPLMNGQRKVLDEILPAIDGGKFVPYLLFGITGSGKTLVYAHAARQAVERGATVLVLVPEIALSGLLLSSMAAFFGDRVAILHSGLTPSQRLAIRQRILTAEIKVVIGPRSAIFAPLPDLRLIIVDEEHDPAYKQDDPAPRYHGRDAAVMLAQMNSCPVILGSASPSMESYHNAVSGRYRLLTLDQRPRSGYRMPQIAMLDMKTEKISGECSFLSFRLKRETENRIASGGQVIYYLNRRGFSPRFKCRRCGHVPLCADCGVTLTYHRSDSALKCHFCDHAEPAPQVCPRCQGTDFAHIGTGTQRVEENLARLFSTVKAERIDSDRTASKSGRLILGDFAEMKFDLLLGTQMVTKGLDFPNVTLVGVLDADVGLDMPDFRAGEKTFARLLQVAGRTGRGDRQGLVMVQTYYDNHPVIARLADGDYVAFFDSVIEERRQLFYPPFSRLVHITLTSVDEKALETEAARFRARLDEKLIGIDDAVILGPAKAPLYKLRGRFRRRFLLKCARIKPVLARLRAWTGETKSFGLPSKIRPVIDVDPVNMM